MRSRDWRGLIPREHGSWAYLLAPQIAAVLAAPRPGEVAVWGLACTLLFAGFQGFAAAQRRREWASAAGALAGAAGGAIALWAARAEPAVLLALAPGLVPAVLGLASKGGRLGRAAPIEVSGIVATSIAAAGGLLLGGGTPRTAVLLTVAASSYFLVSLIWIRLRLSAHVPGRAALLPQGWNIPASVLLLLASATVGVAAGSPVIGLSPGLYFVRVLLPVPRRPDGRLRIPRLGIQEAVMASFFAVGLGLFLPA
jgi:hypothetical protein